MAIVVDEKSRIVVQGLTGREGSFHAQRNQTYGTNVVAGVTPGKGGQEVNGIPVFDTMRPAVEATAADVSLIFVPPARPLTPSTRRSTLGWALIVAITEGIPAHDMLRIFNYLQCRAVTLIGPNCPGVISPGKANVGIMPFHIFMPGPVGIVSRSGTLTYQIANELTHRGIGQSSAVGIGGDPIVGSTYVDILALYEADPETRLIVMVGEIGGDEEETAARYIAEHMTKPVVGYVAGFTAPPGKQMGHAGAIISGSSGTARAKQMAMEAAGMRVGSDPTDVAELVAEVLAGR